MGNIEPCYQMEPLKAFCDKIRMTLLAIFKSCSESDKVGGLDSFSQMPLAEWVQTAANTDI